MPSPKPDQVIIASSATLLSWSVNPDTGAITIQWDGGAGSVYSGMDFIWEDVMALSTVENARKLLLAWFLARSPDASNPNLVTGKTLTFDLNSATAIKVQ